jgi:hypothetical protein
MTLKILSGGMYEVVDPESGRSEKIYGMWATDEFLRGVQFAFQSRSTIEKEHLGQWKEDI